MRIFVIAEAGSSWWRDYERMIMLIQIAAEAGASAVKFQWASNGQKVAEYRHAPELAAVYQQYLQWPEEWHEQLHHDAEKHHIEYMCTVYLSEDLPVIAPYVRRFKISSFENQNRAFIEAVCAQGKPILTSTGLTKNDSALTAPMRPGDGLLHCTSAYPTPVSEANLAVITHWRQVFRRIAIGLSDHTGHVLTGALAVAAGAQVIEVHIRLEDTPSENPDYGHSLPPTKLKEYISNIRTAEAMLGDGIKRIMPCEESMLKYRVKG